MGSEIGKVAELTAEVTRWQNIQGRRRRRRNGWSAGWPNDPCGEDENDADKLSLGPSRDSSSEISESAGKQWGLKNFTFLTHHIE